MDGVERMGRLRRRWETGARSLWSKGSPYGGAQEVGKGQQEYLENVYGGEKRRMCQEIDA